MSRPVDWSPLDLGADPVVGDPAQVEASGRHYQQVADAIEAAAARLREIVAATDMHGQMVDAFRDKARSVADDVTRAHTRYRGVGDALVAYAAPLEIAQSDSALALLRARDAQERLVRGRNAASAAQIGLEGAAPEVDTTALTRAARNAESDVSTAMTELQAARNLCRDAIEDRDDAARRAVAAIREVEDSGDLKDGWWDNWGAKVVGVITDIAGAVAAIAGVAALLVGWIPIVGQVLAAALGTIALVASIVSLLGNIALASTGYRTLTDVLLDVVSVATFGVGRAVTAGARASFGATRGATRLAAGRAAATSPAVRAAAGLPGGSSQSAIRAMTGADDVAALSRSQARSLVEAGRRSPAVSLTDPLSAARRGVADLPAQLSALRSADWAAALRGAPQAARDIVTAPTWAERLARLYPNSPVLADAAFRGGVHPVIAAAPDVASHAGRGATLTAVGVGAQATGSGVDTYQVIGLFGDEATPSESLQLPLELHVG